jgi:hypothetical protein
MVALGNFLPWGVYLLHCERGQCFKILIQNLVTLCFETLYSNCCNFWRDDWKSFWLIGFSLFDRVLSRSHQFLKISFTGSFATTIFGIVFGLAAADYGFTCPPRFMSVCVLLLLLVCVTDKNCNFSAVRIPIELKLGGDLGLVSQISVHVLVSRFDCFSYCKKTNKKRLNCENRGFRKLEFSQPCQVWLIWNLVGTSGQVLGIVWNVCFVYIIVCLHFVNIKRTHFMDFSAMSSSNVLKLGGCLHPSLTHISLKSFF